MIENYPEQGPSTQLTRRSKGAHRGSYFHSGSLLSVTKRAAHIVCSPACFVSVVIRQLPSPSEVSSPVPDVSA